MLKKEIIIKILKEPLKGKRASVKLIDNTSKPFIKFYKKKDGVLVEVSELESAFYWLKEQKTLVMWECNKCGLFYKNSETLKCSICDNDLFKNSTRRVMFREIDINKAFEDVV